MHHVEDIELTGLAEFLQQHALVDHPGWMPTRINGPVVVAHSDGEIIGAARVYKHWLHPKRWRLASYVIPDFRRRGVGTDLLRMIVNQLPSGENRSLQASVFASNDPAIGFLGRAGFAQWMTTRLGTLDPSDVPGAWHARCDHARISLERHGIHIETLAARPELYRETALFHERIYRDQHAWNPPVMLTPEQCIDLFMDKDELDPSMQFLALEGDVLRGVASLRTTDEPGQFDLGWIGVADVSPESRKPLLMTLIGMCVDAADQRRASIALEIDRVDLSINAIVDQLPVDWGDAWLTFILESWEQ